MIFKDAPCALEGAFKKVDPCPSHLRPSLNNHFKTLVKTASTDGSGPLLKTHWLIIYALS